MAKFTEWLDNKPEKFSLIPPKDPKMVALENAYSKLGSWKEVKCAASWPEGVDVNDFLCTIKERIEKHGYLPQQEWHLRKLHAKVKEVMPEH